MKKLLGLTLISTIIFSCTNPIISPATEAKPSPKVEVKADVNISQLEREVFNELNLVRKSPKEYANKILEYKKLYNGSLLEYPGEIPIQTNEGIKAVDECYQVLSSKDSLPELELSSGLSKAAKYLVEMQSVTTQTGHTGTDGSSPFDRMNKFGEWNLTAAENVDYGNNKADRIVISLLVDDGVSSRGHRDNILSSEFKFIGVAYGSHKTYDHMFVMDFAGQYTEK